MFALRTKVNTEKEENENKAKNREHAHRLVACVCDSFGLHDRILCVKQRKVFHLRKTHIQVVRVLTSIHLCTHAGGLRSLCNILNFGNILEKAMCAIALIQDPNRQKSTLPYRC